MSGQGTRYQKMGYSLPKPMIPVSGRSMISRVLENYPDHWQTHFIIADNHLQTGLPQELSRLRPNAPVHVIPAHKEGPVRALSAMLSTIPDDDPVFVSYCDYGVVWDYRLFEKFVAETTCDAAVISYRGFHPHYLNDVKYAYSRLVGERVVEVREKGSFTNNREDEYASTGGYYFRTASLLKRAMEYQIDKDLRANGELYVSLTVEALLRIDPKAHVRVFEVPFFFQWGTPQDLLRFEYWERVYSFYNRSAGRNIAEVEQILMPMAGKGSRLAEVIGTPKPFIKIHGEAMYSKALHSLPVATQKNVFVTLLDHKSLVDESQGIFEFLPKTPQGQALSTLSGISKLNLSLPVLVSSCDHGIVLNPEAWESFQNDSHWDAAIFTINGFPGIFTNPTHWSYVISKEEGVSEVTKVFVKSIPSDGLVSDQVLIGSFWFRSGEILRDIIDQLVERGIQVNGEFYLDSVFDLLIESGKKVCAIPLDGYINWGDSESLSEALYWYEVFCARSLIQRTKFPGVTK